MKHCCQFTRTLISVIFALVFCGIPLHTSGQANENVKPGAIILLSAKGLVQAIDPVGNVVAGILKPGAVLAEGYSLKTGFGGEAALLFSNGTVATLEPRSLVKIASFLQKGFEAGEQKLSEVQQEPSSSQISLDLDTGSLVVQTKKLDRTSSFTIDSPVGTAGIRGTEFQMGIAPTGETKLDVASSSVAFTPTGGTPVLVSQGKGLDVSSTGTVNQRPIDPVISININTKTPSLLILLIKSHSRLSIKPKKKPLPFPLLNLEVQIRMKRPRTKVRIMKTLRIRIPVRHLNPLSNSKAKIFEVFQGPKLVPVILT